MQLVQKAIKADEEELSSSPDDDESIFSQRKKVEALLRETIKKRKGHKNISSGAGDNRNRMLFERNSSSESESEEMRLPRKKARLNIADEPELNNISDSPPFVETEHEVEGESPPLVLGDDDEDDDGMQECLKKLEDEDSNYESMAEDNFVMSPPVVFLNDELDDSIAPEVIDSSSPSTSNQRTSTSSTVHNQNKPTTSSNKNCSKTYQNNKKPASSTQWRKGATRKRQTKIHFSRSPSPSLVRSSSPSLLQEDDLRLTDFIVNDTKDKHRVSSKRQTHIPLTAPSNSKSQQNTSRNNQNRKKATSKNQRQQNLHAHLESVDEPTSSSHVISGPVFRVKVRISNQCLLIPCQQADEQTIEWLTHQVPLFDFPT